ncbi:phosphorylase superfamily protein [Archangium gephyra]|uniref:Phosphorylase superfamily protein n=1 Tax=Archangium gephyra TaxID=48 RepID=A0AAC8Q1S7_9BACT|nr:hypothetical protein [Archangium gephyra]AKI99409.1 Hypothetical protein AA314_01036 [Archangium gephyra]REG28044.1 phosphorylase superfamily protein [Archangium gephyra]
MAEAGAPPHVDVLIVTALKEEYDAVLRVDTGAWRESTWKQERDALGLERAFRTFQAAHGGALRVLVNRVPEMGGEATAGTVAPLISTYKPRCLAMCGVCAGHEGKVELGDVIIADLLWNYEHGKLERTGAGKGTRRIKHRNISYRLRPDWEQRAPSFQPDSGSPWLMERPRPYSAQMDWLLERLLLGEEPAQHPQRRWLCSDYTQVLEFLRERKWIYSKGPPRLTKAGEQHIQQRRGDHPDGLPEPKPFRVHVGPIATGCKVIKDPEIFETLSETDYKVLGLEMEASSIGALARIHQLDMLVMKGVMDFADPAKNDNFKPFAARASAECLLAFLREHLLTGTVPPSQKEPADPQVLAEALATYKQARAEDPRIRQLNLQGLAGIAPGPHRTELDLLDFAVAPSLHDAAEEEGSREAMLRQQLNARDLEPARRRELEAELVRLERERWEHHGGLDRRTISFAQALRHSKRFVIIGDPGAGKSVLTRLALLACMEEDVGDKARRLLLGDRWYDREEGEAVSSLGGLLPVRLSLGGLGNPLAKEGWTLEDCIREELRHQQAPAPLIDRLGELLAAGRIFLILDGLDEVPDRQRERVVDAVVALAKNYPEVRLLATSRPNGYHPRIQGFGYTRLAPLHDRQQHDLVSRLHHLVETHHRGDEHAVERARHRTHALLHAIRTRDEWRELSSNPLLLTLCALTKTHEGGVPKHRVFLFENFIRTILVQWRSVVPAEAEKQLLDAWSSVASTLVQRELRRGVMEAEMLRLLEDALGGKQAAAPVDAETALRLAIETGLVRKEEETVAFWHSTFAEFLAARAFTGELGRGAAQRLLEAHNLPPLVLQFATARLCHVLTASREVDALIDGLLARDEVRAHALLRPGLRAVSACLGDGVVFSSALVQRVWSTWTEVLESTPPSPLWDSFGRLAQHGPRPKFPAPLVARLARAEAHAVQEVRLGLARLVAPYAGAEPAAREACEHWLEKSTDGRLKFHGAYGLASAGVWTEPVIQALGRFGATKEVPSSDVGTLVRRAPSRERERLRALARRRFPAEETPPPAGQSPSHQPEEQTPRELRFSAACLLAVGGGWDEEVAWVLRQTLAGKPTTQHTDEAKTVVLDCSKQAHVRTALLEWLGEDETVRRSVLALLAEVAPRAQELPEALLERATTSVGTLREELLSLLVSIGEVRPSFIEALQHVLAAQEAPGERRICAASILRRLTPRDERLHEALRHGMRLLDAMSRARWAHLAFGLSRELTDTALAALQSCARAPEQHVRTLVYDGTRTSRWQLWQEPLEGWLACASDRGVPAAARLEAVHFLAGSSADQAYLESILRELLDAEDPAVRLGALEILSWKNKLDARALLTAAREAARTGNEEAFMLLIRNNPIAFDVLQAFLHALPTELPPTDSEDRREQLRQWNSYLTRFVANDLSCVELLLDFLEHPGLAGDAAGNILHGLLHTGHPVHGALQERLARAANGTHQLALRRLVKLGLDHEKTCRAAIEAFQSLDLHALSPRQLRWFASLLGSKVLEDAIRAWRLVLDGEDLALVLEAATKLSLLCPQEASAWLSPALTRVFASPEPSDRLNAARLALASGLLEEQALAALRGCIVMTGQKYMRDWSIDGALSRIHERSSGLGPEQDARLEEIFLRWTDSSIHLVAMHELCRYRPDTGMRQLAAWLDAEDEERFRCAVKLLSTRSEYREAVREALARRLGSAPARQLERLAALVEKHGFVSEEMVEQLLARYPAGFPSFPEADGCLISWLRAHPELWAWVRRQEPARRSLFARLLQAHIPVTRDTVSFAAGFAFEYATRWWVPAEWALENWCKPSTRMGEQHEEKPHTPSPETVREWLRETLDARATPGDLASFHLFDHLAALGELPTERRITVLRHALDLDRTELESEEERRAFLYSQAIAGCRLLELGCRDERIPSILEAAVYECTTLENAYRVQLLRSLLTLRPADEALRRFLVRSTIEPTGLSFLDQDLEVLEQYARFSSTELIDVLSARLQSHTPRKPTEASKLLDALERLGCAREQRAALLLEFVYRCGAALPANTLLELAARAELSDSDSAKVLLSIIAQPGREMREAAQQWLARFSSQPLETDDKQRWLLYTDSIYLWPKLVVLAKLSQVDDPAWLDTLLAELVGAPADGHLTRYRRARDGDPLLDSDWAELTAWLTAGPGDEPTTRLAKQWLTLGLWRALEPSTVDPMLRS